MDNKSILMRNGCGLLYMGAIVGLLACPARCQDAYVPAPPKDEPQLMQVFKLKSTPAESVLQTANQIFPIESGAAFHAVDAENNSIIVRGYKKQIEQFAALIDLIDQQAVAGDAAELRIYDLKYMEVDAAADVLRSMLEGEKSTRLTSEPRLNRMIVLGTEAVHKRVQQILEQLDQPAKALTSSVLKLEADSRGSVPAEQLLYNAADKSGVQLELMPQLGVAVARGSKNAVDEFRQDVTSVLDAAAAERQYTEPQTKSENLLVRVVWLADFEAGGDLPNGLAPIAKRAAEFGIEDLKLMGQLVSIASVGEERTQEFEMHGQTSSGFRFSTSGSISFAAASHQHVTAFLRIDAANSGGAGISPVAQLSLNLPVDKPTMIASAPIDGNASVFVIEVLRND